MISEASNASCSAPHPAARTTIAARAPRWAPVQRDRPIGECVARRGRLCELVPSGRCIYFQGDYLKAVRYRNDPGPRHAPLSQQRGYQALRGRDVYRPDVAVVKYSGQTPASLTAHNHRNTLVLTGATANGVLAFQKTSLAEPDAK